MLFANNISNRDNNIYYCEKELTSWEIAYEKMKDIVSDYCKGLGMSDKDFATVLDTTLETMKNYSKNHPRTFDLDKRFPSNIVLAFRDGIKTLRREFLKTPAGRNCLSTDRVIRTFNCFTASSKVLSKEERDKISDSVFEKFFEDIDIPDNNTNAESNFLYNLYYEYKTTTDNKRK